MKWISYQISASYNELYLFNWGNFQKGEREKFLNSFQDIYFNRKDGEKEGKERDEREERETYIEFIWKVVIEKYHGEKWLEKITMAK